MSWSEFRSEEELRECFGYPAKAVVNKVRSSLHEYQIAFIDASPFCLIATSDDAGNCDVSPKGDPAGAFKVIDEKRLAIADRPGNRRLDGWMNVLRNPKVGILFIIPGRDDTLRVNGRARLLKEADFFDDMVIKGHRPKLVLLVEIDEAFFHCSKAFLRSHFWDPNRWTPDLVPRRAVIAQALENPECTVEELDARYGPQYLEGLYKST